MQIWALIVDSFREAIDRKVFWIMVTLSVVVAASMACIGFDENGANVLFGTWEFEAPGWEVGAEDARGRVASLVVRFIADLTMGWVGIILALVATASTFPSLMERGTIDIVLSKPITRTRLFLGKYLGAMTFILIQAVIFVGLTFVVIGTRWHHWLWAYLWMIPLLVLLFSYVFCFCALFSVLTRRAVPALLLTLIAWVVIWVPDSALTVFANYPELDEGGRWRRIFRTVRYVLPKTQDIAVIAAELLEAAPETEVMRSALSTTEEGVAALERAREAEIRLAGVGNAFESIGTSLASEAVVVMLAIWVFRRKDF